jgi:hypothetical protein
MKNKRRLTTLFLILLLILGVGALITKGIYYKYETEFHGNQASTTGAIPITPIDEDGYAKYENSAYGFTLFYPETLEIADPKTAGNLDGLDEANIFTARIPANTFATTSLRNVYIIAGAKNNVGDESCERDLYGNEIGGDQVKINDVTWHKGEFEEGAAGSVYKTVRYSRYKDSVCYEILARAESRNPTDYNEEIYTKVLDEMASFFSLRN